MPRAHSKRHRLILTLLSIPAALTALFWLATHFWFTWYATMPIGPVPPGAVRAPSIRSKIHAGAIHITDDATMRRATTPLKPGTVTLGHMLNADRTITQGLSIRWYPTLPDANTWTLDMQPGNWRIPLYIPLAILTALPFLYLTVTSAATPGHCPKCNYNRAGLAPLVKCPECGHTPSSI